MSIHQKDLPARNSVDHVEDLDFVEAKEEETNSFHFNEARRLINRRILRKVSSMMPLDENTT